MKVGLLLGRTLANSRIYGGFHLSSSLSLLVACCTRTGALQVISSSLLVAFGGEELCIGVQCSLQRYFK